MGGDKMALVLETLTLIMITWALWLGLRPSINVKDKKEIGVRGATAIYTDEKGTKLLVAPKYELQGKPDFIFETWFLKRYIPLEIKSGKLKEEVPHPGDVYQLAAYFLIIEEVYGKRPPYGKLVYANKTFTIRNTFKIRHEIKSILRQMRNMLEEKEMPIAEPSFMKCKNCICKGTVCEFNEGEY